MIKDELRGDVQAILSPGEVLLDITDGMFQQGALITSGARRTALFVTDQRVGFLTRKIGGQKVLDFSYALITSFEYKRGMAFGEIRLTGPSDKIVFQRIPKDEVERVGQAIREQMSASRTPAGTTPPPVSIADEIGKLADLRDRGLLNDDEFEAQKSKLLLG